MPQQFPSMMNGCSLDKICWEVGSVRMKSPCKQQIRVWQRMFQRAFEYCNIWLPPEPNDVRVRVHELVSKIHLFPFSMSPLIHSAAQKKKKDMTDDRCDPYNPESPKPGSLWSNCSFSAPLLTSKNLTRKKGSEHKELCLVPTHIKLCRLCTVLVATSRFDIIQAI